MNLTYRFDFVVYKLYLYFIKIKVWLIIELFNKYAE